MSNQKQAHTMYFSKGPTAMTHSVKNDNDVLSLGSEDVISSPAAENRRSDIDQFADLAL